MNITTLLIGVFLIAHGLIHASYGSPPPPPGPVPWPFTLNHSWLLAPLRLDAFARPLGTLLWLATTIGFVATGLGFLGVPVLHEGWRALALFSAAASFTLLVLFWNPMLVLGIVIDAVIVAALFWNNLPLRGLASS